jgi:hypothetical protein
MKHAVVRTQGGESREGAQAGTALAVNPAAQIAAVVAADPLDVQSGLGVAGQMRQQALLPLLVGEHGGVNVQALRGARGRCLELAVAHRSLSTKEPPEKSHCLSPESRLKACFCIPRMVAAKQNHLSPCRVHPARAG